MEPKANDAGVGAVLPEEIQQKLRALVRRARRVIFLRGVLAVAAVLLASVLGVMAIDASFTIFSGWIRWALSLSALALTVWTAIRFLIKPLSRKISLAAVARAVEAHHPEMEERVSTAVELLSRQSKFDRGSEQLLKKVVEFAVKDVGDVTPETEFTTRSARKFKWAAVAALGVFGLAFVVWPKQVGLLFARALAPFAEIGNAYSGKIRSITGDLTVAKGEPVTLEVVIEDPGVRKADLRTVIAGAEVEAIERMEREGDGGDGTRKFVFRIPAVAESFDYRVHCGKILSSTHTVEALDRPAVSKLEITYRYPEYTGLGVETLAEGTREILAPVGTGVSLRAGLNREVEQMALTVNGEELPAPEMDDLYGQPVAAWSFVLTPGLDSVWRIDLKDEHEIEGSEGEYAVQAVADEKPTVTLRTPEEREIRVRPTETIPMAYSATEDYGFSAVEVLVKKEPGGQEVVLQELPVRAADDRRAWDGRAALSLAKLNLQGAERLRARLRVKDTLPAELGGANEALSEELVIVLDRGARTLFDQTVAAEAEDFKKEIWETMNELREARWRAENSADQMKSDEAMRPETLQRLQETQEKAQSATERLEALADRMEESAFARNAEPMREIASDHTEPAAETAAEIPLSDDRDERVAEAQSIVEEIDEALSDLDATIQAIDEARPEMADAARLDQMAQEQQQLATQAAETQTPPPAPSEVADAQEAGSPPPTQEQAAMTADEQRQWQQQQQQLANEIAAMAEQQEQQAERNAGLQQQSEQAQELAQEASQLARAEEELADLIDDTAGDQGDDAVRDQLLAALQREQESIAAEAEAMQEGAAPSGASEQAQEAVSEAAESANAALEGLEEAVQEGSEGADERVSEAAQAAQAAAQKLAEAAGSEGLPESSAEAEAAMSEAAAEASRPEGATEGGEGDPAGGDEPAGSGEEAGGAESSPSPGAPAEAEGGETPAGTEAGPEAGAEAAGEPSGEGAAAGEGGEASEAGEGADAAGGEPMAASQEGLLALAERQAQVAEVLEALDGGGVEAALAEMQGQLAEQGEALAEATGSLQKQVQQNQAPSQAMSQALNDAASELAEGAAQAGEASEALGEAAASGGEPGEPGEAPAGGDSPEGAFAEAGQPAAGKAAAQAAQESFAEAAQSLATAAEGLAAQAQGQAGQGEALQAAAEAAGEAAQAAQPGQPGEGAEPGESGQMSEAAQSAQEAANALAAAAQSAMQSMGVPQGFMPSSALAANQPAGQGQPGQPGQQPGQPPGQPGQTPGQPAPGEGAEPNQEGVQANLAYSDIPPALAKLGVSVEDWMRIKGTAQSAVGGGQSAQVPAEYRELVRGYFEALSKGGGE